MIVDKHRQVIYLSSTVEGRIHDKRLLEEIHSNKRIKLRGDLGFYGYQHPFITVQTPQKKPKGKSLTEEQKRENQKHNGLRVKIEHVFAHLKSLRVVKDRIRN